jgi:hypothetical protein
MVQVKSIENRNVGREGPAAMLRSQQRVQSSATAPLMLGLLSVVERMVAGRARTRDLGVMKSALELLQIVTSSHTTLTFITTCRRYGPVHVCID